MGQLLSLLRMLIHTEEVPHITPDIIIVSCTLSYGRQHLSNTDLSDLRSVGTRDILVY